MNNEVKIPNHLAIIMDGNGRWAKNHGKSRSAGHLEGSKNLERIANYAFTKGIKCLSVFAFSTENFKRSKEEVDYLMDLFVKMFQKKNNIFQEKNIKVVFSKCQTGLPEKVETSIIKQVEMTKNNTAGILNICINYGGRREISDALKKICQEVVDEEISIDDINEALIEKHLYQDLPPIDLLIRTSNELRISNFMLWQLAYAEMYFAECHFPDFNEKELDKALIEYTKRDRRYGGIKYDQKTS